MKRRSIAIFLVLLLLTLTGSVAIAQTSSALWFVKYWDNPDLEGEPVERTSTGVIDYDWGNGAPDSDVGANKWSGRWTSMIDFSAGTYRFTTISDDGVRLYVGDKHIILDWNKGAVRTNVATVSLSGGNYPVALDYFEDKGPAELEMYWERLGPPSATGGYVTIVNSGQAANPPSGTWWAEYWNNQSLQGSPAVTRSEARINYNWGNGSPATGIDPDTWSARWTSNIHFPAGTYRFAATMDDGMRVWVDGSLVIDAWYDSEPHTITAERYLSAGTHNIRVDYYENGGGAVARLSWQTVSAPPAPTPTPITNWRGEYFANVSLSGSPVLVRDDANVNFNWGFGSPAASLVPSDNFSVRWSRSVDLVPGRYRFSVVHDDGVRLWAGDRLLIDRWFDQAAGAAHQAEIDWPGGVVNLRMEYYERSGLAQVNLSWNRVGAAADTGGQPTASVNTGALNFRAGPGTNYSIITAYPRDTVVTLMARNDAGNWVYVMAPNGQLGWMHAGYLTTTYPINSLSVVSG